MSNPKTRTTRGRSPRATSTAKGRSTGPAPTGRRPPAARTSSSRPRRSTVAAARRGGRSRFPWLLTVTAIAIVLAALAAVAVTLTSDDTTEATAFDEARATVDGTPLAALPDTGADSGGGGSSDPAVGQPAPTIEGRTRDGDTLTAPTTGRPTVLLFLAHWCPHCQREVPALQEWVDAGEWPDDVDLVAVSTAIDPARPNYPPTAWLEREGWSTPTIADADGTAAAAYGLTGFPFWVAVDADGTVVERRSGELTLDQLLTLTDAADAG